MKSNFETSLESTHKILDKDKIFYFERLTFEQRIPIYLWFLKKIKTQMTVNKCERLENMGIRVLSVIELQPLYRLFDEQKKNESLWISENNLDSVGLNAADMRAFFAKKDTSALSNIPFSFQHYKTENDKRKQDWYRFDGSQLLRLKHESTQSQHPLEGTPIDKDYKQKKYIWFRVTRAFSKGNDAFKEMCFTLCPDWFHLYINQGYLQFWLTELSSEERNIMYNTLVDSINKSFTKINSKSLLPSQKIFFGAPGTGKSYLIDEEINKPNRISFRTVFHPETSSSDFFGNLEPVTKYQSMSPLVGHVSDSKIEYSFEGLIVSKQSASIVYEFAPGPFMRAVKSAIHNPEKPHVLVIEEINRAHAAAVFGEVFQLLDREDSGWSRYPIVISDSAFRYLETDTLASNPLDKNSVKIPPNLSLYATMNTVDQGVYPMDTAFKRRWQFTYVPLNGKTDNWKHGDWNPQIPMLDCRWQELRVTINSYLLEKSRSSKIEMPIPEDKLIGPYFLSKIELSSENITDSIIEKVLFYLQFDVLKYSPKALFVQSLTMSEIREGSVAGKLMESFHKDFQDALPSQKKHKEIDKKEGALESNNAE